MQSTRPTRKNLNGAHFDVIVIGGGINGIAVARECAQGGRTVLIVDARDFAGGTTSRATRIIHGGLRYLEHGEIALVRESLRERDRLLRERPHLVRPLRFVLAMPSFAAGLRSGMALRAGLWLYKQLGGRSSSARLESALDLNEGLQLFDYEDAQCEYPERLAAEWLDEAVQHGAVARNHCEVLEITVADGQAKGICVRDEIEENEQHISGNWIINASGPWADRVCATSNIDQRRLIGGVKGSHIIVERWNGAPNAAVYTEANDKRPFFVVPWAGQMLIGTTESADDSDPASVTASLEDVQYLFANVKRSFPRAHITPAMIRGSYAGIRPLPFAPKRQAAAITRRSFIHDHLEDGTAHLLTLVGGKLTTAANLGRQTARYIGIKNIEPVAQVAFGHASGIESALHQWTEMIAGRTGVAPTTALAVAEWHGRSAARILQLTSDPRMAQPICPHTKHIVAEAHHAFAEEFAVTLADVLLRRVPVALGPCWSEECAVIAAQRIGAAMGWNDKLRQNQLESFLQERALMMGTARPLVAAQ